MPTKKRDTLISGEKDKHIDEKTTNKQTEWRTDRKNERSPPGNNNSFIHEDDWTGKNCNLKWYDENKYIYSVFHKILFTKLYSLDISQNVIKVTPIINLWSD